jgi:hypothetical protein
MSWNRGHIEELSELQIRTQRLIESAGIEAPGVEWLIQVNECLVAAQGFAVIQLERHDEALAMAEALRPFANVAEGDQ